MPADSALLTKAYQSSDRRNYMVQVAASALDAANVGLPGSVHAPTTRVVVVVSHGNFDSGRQAPIPFSASSASVSTAPPPSYHVSYALLDAQTGAYLGGEAKTDPCVRE